MYSKIAGAFRENYDNICEDTVIIRHKNRLKNKTKQFAWVVGLLITIQVLVQPTNF